MPLNLSDVESQPDRARGDAHAQSQMTGQEATQSQRWLTHQAAIALGSNLGPSASLLSQALQTLDQTPGIEVYRQSHYYTTAPVGPPQPDYLNACAILQTCLTPRALLQTLLSVEAQFGRERRERWGPRRLDLDLLLFEDWVLDEPDLQLPHPRMSERAFVLVPLAEIAPDWVHPVSGRAIARLLDPLDRSGVMLANDAVQPSQRLL